MTKVMMRESLVKEIEPTSKGLIKNPISDLVVTRSKNGKALSVFSDDIWDYSATSNSLKTINFRAKIQHLPALSNVDSNKLSLAVKFLKIFALNWVCEVNGCSMSKLNGDLVAISFLVSHCLINHVNFNGIFTDANAIDFLVTNSSAEKQIGLCLGKIQRFIDTASVLNQNDFWCELQPSEEFLNKLKKTRKIFPETSQSLQTMVIPSRIYQSLLKDTIEPPRLYRRVIYLSQAAMPDRVKLS